MASYKLPLGLLSPGIQEFDYQLDSSFFSGEEPDEVRGASITVHLTADRKTDTLVELELHCTGELTLPCDRCLDDMQLPVDATYRLSVKSGKELDDSRDGVLIIPEHWRELDLEPLMRDTVLLAIPIKHVHPEGQCNPEMLARLDEHAAAMQSDTDMPAGPEAEEADGGADEENDNDGSGTDPRWDALKQLIDKNKEQ